jgi:hypothetical protein
VRGVVRTARVVGQGPAGGGVLVRPRRRGSAVACRTWCSVHLMVPPGLSGSSRPMYLVGPPTWRAYQGHQDGDLAWASTWLLGTATSRCGRQRRGGWICARTASRFVEVVRREEAAKRSVWISRHARGRRIRAPAHPLPPGRVSRKHRSRKWFALSHEVSEAEQQQWQAALCRKSFGSVAPNARRAGWRSSGP